MYFLKFETKIIQFEPLVSLCSFNSLQISIKAKWLISREVLSVTCPNFTVVKYNSKTSNICHHIKFRKSILDRCSMKKLFLKILQYSQENTYVGVFFNKNAGVQSVTLIKRDSNTGVFLWVLRNFWEHLFWKISFFSISPQHVPGNVCPT